MIDHSAVPRPGAPLERAPVPASAHHHSGRSGPAHATLAALLALVPLVPLAACSAGPTDRADGSAGATITAPDRPRSTIGRIELGPDPATTGTSRSPARHFDDGSQRKPRP